MARPLNPLTLPLHGTALIEASAGTGKTYSIAALYTRMVAAEDMHVPDILVVTFTKAAAAELKTRLRAWLGSALAVLQEETHAAKPEPVLQDIIAAALEHTPREQLVLRLQAAVSQFDNAAVYTIHGFCQRVLADHAFLCNSPFDSDIIDNDPVLLRTFAEDFWRRNVSNRPETAALAVRFGCTPQTVTDKFLYAFGRPRLYARRPPANDPAECRQQFDASFSRLCAEAEKVKNGFYFLHPHLHKGTYKQANFDNLFDTLAEAAACRNPELLAPFSRELNLCAAETLYTKLNKSAKELDKNGNEIVQKKHLDCLIPAADMGAAFAQRDREDEENIVRLQTDCLEYVRGRLQEHRRNSPGRTYDDLIADVAAALAPGNPQAEPLAEKLAGSWRIALIDECQDTDPLQSSIFQTVFADRGLPLLMVGDPKQAIYGFRGADIRAYLRIAADTPPGNRYTLATNYRTHDGLVQAVHALFAGKKRPFVLDGITCPDVRAARQDSALLPAPPALTVRWLNDPDEAGKKAGSEEMQHKAAACCADEIADILARGKSGTLFFKTADDSHPAVSGDIAVLVRTHGEGALMAGELRARGISCVSPDRDSVFDSPEAQAVGALLSFWLTPRKTELLRYVLGSTLYDATAAELAALNENGAALNRYMDLAGRALERWQTDGIFTALAFFSAQTGLETVLLQRGNDRSLTNFRQLAEILAAMEQDFPVRPALLRHFEDAVHHRHNARGESELRLESDERLVRIITMHAAKGLEYGIVFCPFVWRGRSAPPADWYEIHRPDGIELVHKSLLADEDKQRMAEDTLGEELRLCYVAFTRAREQLVIYAAAAGKIETGPFAYLFDGCEDGTPEDTAAYWKNCKSEQASVLKTAWEELAAHSGGRTVFTETFSAHETLTADTEPPVHYRALELPPRRYSFVRHTSFTALSRHTAPENDDFSVPELDDAETAAGFLPDMGDGPQDVLLPSFPGGIPTGLCLHALLEETDFSHPAAAQTERYRAILQRYGFAAELADEAATAADAVRESLLADGVCLSAISANNTLSEMAFVMKAESFGLPALRTFFEQPETRLPEVCRRAAQHLDFAAVDGFINGAVDLIAENGTGPVFVVDYKSNKLGDTSVDYGTENLNDAVAGHHYYLQALIYSLAVARYLDAFDRRPPLICVRYLFLRGLKPGSAAGIWQWDIDTETLLSHFPLHDK